MTDQPTITYRLQEALRRPPDVIRIEEHHRLIMEALLELLNPPEQATGIDWDGRLYRD